MGCVGFGAVACALLVLVLFVRRRSPTFGDDDRAHVRDRLCNERVSRDLRIDKSTRFACAVGVKLRICLRICLRALVKPMVLEAHVSLVSGALQHHTLGTISSPRRIDCRGGDEACTSMRHNEASSSVWTWPTPRMSCFSSSRGAEGEHAA